MKLIFAGTPDFAAAALESLLRANHEIVAVYTQPDRKVGRGQKIQMSAVKQLALKNNLTVYQPISLKDPDVQAILKTHEADLMIVAAYGLILPQAVLDIPKEGCINIHASLLPRWRGAAPIQRAIQNGDIETGITIMQMDVGLDTGDMLLKKSVLIDEKETSATLHDKLASLGGDCIVASLEKFSQLQPIPQNDSDATYAKKMTKSEAVIDWHMPAHVIEKQIRAFNPWPVCYTHCDEMRVRIFAATVIESIEHQQVPGTIFEYSPEKMWVACGESSVLNIQTLQLPGANIVKASELYHAKKDLFLNVCFS